MENLEGHKVIYISGYGRSGSTLLSMLMNTLAGIYNMGEVDNLYQMQNDELSHYWRDLREKTLSDPENSEKARIRFSGFNWYFRLGKGSKLFQTFWIPVLKQFKQDYMAKAIVDASKSTFTTFCRPFYYQRFGADIKVIHLVRDPSDVAHSYAKGRNLSNSETLEAPKKGGAYRALISWFLTNTFTSIIYRRRFSVKEFYVLSYDELMNNYNTEIKNVMKFLELDLNPELFKEEIELSEDLSFSGNRLRLRKSIKIEPYKLPPNKGFQRIIANFVKRTYKKIEKEYD